MHVREYQPLAKAGSFTQVARPLPNSLRLLSAPTVSLLHPFWNTQIHESRITNHNSRLTNPDS